MAALTRRLFLSRAPLAAAATVLTVAPIAAAARPPAILPPEIIAATKEWQAALAAKDKASDAYCGPNAPKFHLPCDHPIRSAWIDADDAATKAQWKVLNLLKSMAVAS